MQSSGVLACLQPAEGPASQHAAPYGELRGSTPSWQGANMTDRGQRHVQVIGSGELGASGFEGWYAQQSSGAKPLRRHIDQASSSVYAEPSICGAHPSYYARRAISAGDDGGTASYRPSMRQAEQHERAERPQGKRAIPEPYGPPPRTTGTQMAPDSVRYGQSASLPEPNIPHMGRPPGAFNNMPSNSELPFEVTVGRKVRVGQESYYNTGRAGDLSLVYSCPKRVEDTLLDLNRTNKDNPTFTRFVNSLPPKPERSPHEHRAAGMARARQAEVAAERQLVASLQLPSLGDADD